MSIRTIKHLSDFKYIAEAYTELDKQHKSYDSTEWKGKIYSKWNILRLLKEGKTILNCNEEGRVTGILTYKLLYITQDNRIPHPELQIRRLYIFPEYRRRHAAKDLVEYAYRLAISANATLSVQCYNSNVAGMSFYDKYGFKKQFTKLTIKE